MKTKLEPYLNFKDNAREAMEFYHKVLGGRLDMVTFKEYHASEDPSEDNKIMNAYLEAENGLSFMASDTPNSMEFKRGTDMSMALSGENEAELRDYYGKLSEGGEIIMPLDPAPWGAIFGMFKDKFGVQWMVNISAPESKV